MLKAHTAVYLDSIRPKKNGLCSVKIKVTYNRKRKYYSTGIDLTPSEFEQTLFGKRKTNEQKEFNKKISYFENKANDVIKDLHIFSFDAFQEKFLENRNTANSVSFAFDKYIDELKLENRLGTASSYECAKNSISEFRSGLTFAEITPKFLKKYQKWMTDNGRSISTVGIYLRSLRAVYNEHVIDKSAYPFGKGKYTIPTSKNTKKALTLDEIGKIYNHVAVKNSAMEMAKDYWIFMYLSNGMNVKDLCLLKWKNIDGNILTYKRAKTERSNKEQKTITVALKADSLTIIKKWSIPSLNKDAYIFPHFSNKMDALQMRKAGKQLTKKINKYVKKIAIAEGINKTVTTYFARHSFATVLKRSGVQTEMISELLGHSSMSVTESYLDSFENEQIQDKTDSLIAFKKAN